MSEHDQDTPVLPEHSATLMDQIHDWSCYFGVPESNYFLVVHALQSAVLFALVLGYVFIVEPATRFLVEKRQLRWKIQGRFAHLDEKLIPAIFERAFEVEISGLENIDPTKLAILTSNHQTLIDYLSIIYLGVKSGLDASVFFFVWKHCVRLPSLSVLYNEWLKRSNWRVPNVTLVDVFAPVLESPWREAGGKWVVVFPEVTPWSASYMMEHRALCSKNGCSKLQNLLYPRFNAFVQAVTHLRDLPTVEVYELSILYITENKVGIPSWYDLVFSEKEWRLRIEVRKKTVSSIPHKEKHIIRWLEKQWYEQDRAITEYTKQLKERMHSK